MGLKNNAPFWVATPVLNPAVGAEIVFPNPGDFVARTLYATWILTTSAVVATRAVTFTVTDGTTTVFRAGSSFTQPASTTYRYSLISSGADFGDPATVCHIPTPTSGVLTLPGWVGRTVTANLQAGDQFSGIGAVFEQFPNGPDFEWVPGSMAQLWERS